MSEAVALVQARMGSTRFPGKMLAPLGGRPILEWVLLRASQSQLLSKVVLATTNLERDDELVRIAERVGIDVYRGSESDVLERFVLAAKKYGADPVVRICADNPFIDPREIDRLVHFFQANQCDYACNHQARLGNQYADGFGAEILSSDLLIKLGNIAVDMRHREHVTTYLWDNFDEFNLKVVFPPPGLDQPDLRFDIDTLADYEYMESLVLKGVGINMAAPHIIALALDK